MKHMWRSTTILALTLGLAMGQGCATESGSDGDTAGDGDGAGTGAGDVTMTPTQTGLAASTGEAGTQAVTEGATVAQTAPGNLNEPPPDNASGGVVSVTPENVRFSSGPEKAGLAAQAISRRADVTISIAPTEAANPCDAEYTVLQFTATEDEAGAIDLTGETSAALTEASVDAVVRNEFVFCIQIVANFAGTVEVRTVDLALSADPEEVPDPDAADPGVPAPDAPDPEVDDPGVVGGEEGTAGPTDPPAVTCPGDLTVECADGGNLADLEAWLESVTADSSCPNLTVSNDFVDLSDECGGTGSATVTFTAADDCGSVSCVATFAVEDTTDPALSGPDDLIGLCDLGGDLSDLEAWLAGATADDDCGTATVTNDFTELSDTCDATVTWTATDECGRTSTHTAAATVIDTEGPVITLEGPAEVVLECAVDTYEELGATVSDDCDTTLTEVTVGGDEVDTGTVGTYLPTYTATDACGNEGDPVTRTVEVVDTLPPTIDADQLIELWPPNHKYATYHLSDCGLTDLCDTDIDAAGTILSISSDEPENDAGDGHTTEDIVIADHSTFMVRSERQGGGNGRVYCVTFEVTDAGGNTAELVCRVGVPHDQSGEPAVDDGPEGGYTVEP